MPDSTDELRRGYEIFLGKPLASFDPNARYEVWYRVERELLPEHERLAALTLEQLVVGRPQAPSTLYDPGKGEFWTRYAADYARSLFVFDRHDMPEAPSELVAALQAKHYALTGEEIGRLVDQSGLAFEEIISVAWYICRRAVTDGTLLDAMHAATLSSKLPLGIQSRSEYGEDADKIRFEPRWEHALRVIEDPVLREHLLMSCCDVQTARWAGAWLDPKHKVDVWLEPVTKRGGEIIAIWHVGEGQAMRAVVQFASDAAPVVAVLADDPSVAIDSAPVRAAPATKPKPKPTKPKPSPKKR